MKCFTCQRPLHNVKIVVCDGSDAPHGYCTACAPRIQDVPEITHAARAHRRRLTTAAFLVGLAILFAPGKAGATPGAMCMHKADCGSGEVCLADSDLSDHGHCTRLRVLP